MAPSFLPVYIGFLCAITPCILKPMYEEIAQLLARYARAVDTKDWSLYRSVFTPDATIDYASAGGITGSLDDVVAWMEKTFEMVESSMHYITNIEVDLPDVRAAFWNPMRFNGYGPAYYGGYYHHNLTLTDDGWRSTRLVEATRFQVTP